VVQVLFNFKTASKRGRKTYWHSPIFTAIGRKIEETVVLLRRKKRRKEIKEKNTWN